MVMSKEGMEDQPSLKLPFCGAYFVFALHMKHFLGSREEVVYYKWRSRYGEGFLA